MAEQGGVLLAEARHAGNLEVAAFQQRQMLMQARLQESADAWQAKKESTRYREETVAAGTEETTDCNVIDKDVPEGNLQILTRNTETLRTEAAVLAHQPFSQRLLFP